LQFAPVVALSRARVILTLVCLHARLPFISRACIKKSLSHKHIGNLCDQHLECYVSLAQRVHIPLNNAAARNQRLGRLRRKLTARHEPTSSCRQMRWKSAPRVLIVHSHHGEGGFSMLASNRIRCTVVALESPVAGLPHRDIARDLLPWADPYVAQLIKNLQDEVRQERQMQALMRQRVRLSQSFPVHERAHLGG
jgi:hypothetical protein